MEKKSHVTTIVILIMVFLAAFSFGAITRTHELQKENESLKQELMEVSYDLQKAETELHLLIRSLEDE